MITQFVEWSSSSGLAETAHLSTIAGATVGIDATEYLNRIQEFRSPAGQSAGVGVQPEPLLPALGGLPFSLGKVVTQQLESFERQGVKPLFVFSGLNLLKDDFTASESAVKRLEEAWRFYDGSNAEAAVASFKASNAIKAADLYRYLQTILRQKNIQWMVAPYTASAQLYYLTTTKTIDLIFGSSEIFLYDVQENITTFNFETDSLVWVRRQRCLQALGGISKDIFVDSCLLAGSDLLPTLPQLEIGANRRNSKIRTAVDLIANVGKGTGNGVCLHYQDDVGNRMQEYKEKFQKAKLTVQHTIVLNSDGKAEALDAANAPGSMHEYIGQRLPDELYGYFARGIIGPRILNWRSSGEALMHPPLDGGESKDYRDLVRQQLNGIQMLSIGLLASTLHYYYQRTDVVKRTWFDKEHPTKVFTKDEYDNEKTKRVIESWNCPQYVCGEEFNKYPETSMFGLCVKALSSKSFTAKTITKKNPKRLLISKDELLANSIWRMLQLRNYIDDSHNLTATGQMLHEMVCNLPMELQESALIACELVQYGKLTGEGTPYGGVPDATPESVKRSMTLVSKVACLGYLDHQEIGYTGILSRNMLAASGVIEAVRLSLRDLLEVCLTTMLLNGDANRDRPDFNDLGLDLPLLLPMSSCLGIAVANHLTDMAKLPDPTNSATREKLLLDEQIKFQYATDMGKSLQNAWHLWDAVKKGIQAGDAKFATAKTAFKVADEWLKPYR